MYKNIIFFSFFLSPKMDLWVEWDSVGDNWDAHTRESTVRFFRETSLSFYFVQVEIFLALYNFSNAHANPRDQTSRLHVARRHASFWQFMWHFRWGTTCILFTFENRCTFCYAPHATYTAYQRDLLVNIQRSNIKPNCPKTEFPVWYS